MRKPSISIRCVTGRFALQAAVIDVSAHGVDRCQRAEPRKYVRAANIPGMDDGIAAGKGRERLRPQQAMGIGNRANGSHHARPDYKRSRAASPCYTIMICAQKGNPPHAETKGDRTLRCRNDRGLDSAVCLYVIFAVMLTGRRLSRKPILY